MVNEWRKANAIKRGGGQIFISLDAAAAEERFQAEPTDGLSPDRVFQKRWAVTLLENVLHRLGEECMAGGNEALFNALRPQVLGDEVEAGNASVAAGLGLTEGALRVALHRLRERYRQLLRLEVGRTVASAQEVDVELRELMAALRG